MTHTTCQLHSWGLPKRPRSLPYSAPKSRNGRKTADFFRSSRARRLSTLGSLARGRRALKRVVADAFAPWGCKHPFLAPIDHLNRVFVYGVVVLQVLVRPELAPVDVDVRARAEAKADGLQRPRPSREPPDATRAWPRSRAARSTRPLSCPTARRGRGSSRATCTRAARRRSPTTPARRRPCGGDNLDPTSTASRSSGSRRSA